MTYIDIINSAWELREQGIISVHEHDLYNYLVHRCNRLNWKNPFNQSTEIICAILGINRNAFTSRRNRLQQLGLIKFKEGTAKTRPAQYTLLCILQDTVKDTHSATLTDTVSYTLDYTLPCTYTKDNTKQDKKEEKKEKEILNTPTVEEISIYCNERQNGIDAGVFFDFYQSKGWMIGRNKMRDWRAAVRVWEKKQPASKHNSADHDNSKSYENF
ncbi:hypothetical protein M2451_002793 [Dysgonomonas sp. PFB1-18]|uniref:hypothetical protein n=1 Tax=unclassified Dysgonomonas TaxID=2630389 RepID=UPI0024770A8E|nr:MULTISPECIES: hypothetical protein [unclassified Dysgonomonas]MDH6309321.1 hypothetical protein [Dysgonomonas sp. PF1-14]MDH6339814.1 hypothetical protein [Dysgonomonas sp. PF1-16]MDH6381462.1 hypothetical protein [Dysgonomonas sp. PFB1-18]MDH6398677.1 hypothetical protein [Dysgonomonas sp. PF1-23]